MNEDCDATPASNIHTVREKLLTAILDNMLDNPLEQASRKAQGLPIRHLPPGKLVDLYRLYIAACIANNASPASISVFGAVWKSEWRHALKFRKGSTHSACRTCHILKSKIRHARGLQEHVDASAEYLAHLQAQWRDRQIYWGLRARAQLQRDIWTLICDGMDRAKYALPRWADNRTPKGGEERRPVLEVSGVLVHGVGVYIFLADEDVSIGSSWTCDIILRAVDFAWQVFQKKGEAFPGT